MATSSRDRWAVFCGILAAWVLTIGFVWGGWRVVRSSAFFDSWPAWHSATLAMVLASLSLVAGIGWAARTRHFDSNIDGSRPAPGSALDITLRYVSNTTEQLLLFVIACVGFADFSSENAAKILPVMGCWFVIARALFYFGYRCNPLLRATGFAATFHPSVVLILLSLLFALS